MRAAAKKLPLTKLTSLCFIRDNPATTMAPLDGWDRKWRWHPYQQHPWWAWHHQDAPWRTLSSRRPGNIEDIGGTVAQGTLVDSQKLVNQVKPPWIVGNEEFHLQNLLCFQTLCCHGLYTGAMVSLMSLGIPMEEILQRMVHKVSQFRVLSLAIEDDPAILLIEGPRNERSAKGSVVSWRGPVYVYVSHSKFADVSKLEPPHPLLPL